MDRAELFAAIDAGWQRLDVLVRSLADDDWRRPLPAEEPGADARTVADVIAHLAAWKQKSLKIAMSQAEPGVAAVDDYPSRVLDFDYNVFNHDVLLEWREQSPTSVLARHRAAHHGLLVALEALPDDRLLVDGRPRRWLRPCLGHLGDHIAELEKAVGPGGTQPDR